VRFAVQCAVLVKRLEVNDLDWTSVRDGYCCRPRLGLRQRRASAWAGWDRTGRILLLVTVVTSIVILHELYRALSLPLRSIWDRPERGRQCGVDEVGLLCRSSRAKV
jgi:hypothetical protein